MYPFPGMNPWLEQPGIWQNVHVSLIAAIRDELAASLYPDYYVDIEQYAYITTVEEERRVFGRPDVAVVESPSRPGAPRQAVGLRTAEAPLTVELTSYEEEEVTQRYLAVRQPRSGRVVTVIELLSPKNKAPGLGRERYEAKRREVLHSETHLVEIDLLRGGQPMPILWRENGIHADYRILVSRAAQRPQAALYPFSVRDAIPRVPIPLLPRDEEPTLDLNPLLRDIYVRARFELVIDYDQPPEPPLPDEEREWVAAQLETGEE